MMSRGVVRSRWALALMVVLVWGCGDDDMPDPKNTPDQGADMQVVDMGADMGEGHGEPVVQDPRAWVVGESQQGRPIIAELYGERGPVLFLLAAIHGDERSAVTFGERFRWHLQGGAAEREGLRVVYVGAANPDGIVANTRRNSRNIDLNRNFDTANFQPGGPGGTTPLSESETRALVGITEAVDPTAVISMHCCVPTIDYDGPGREFAERIASEAGFPAERLGSSNGSMGSWVGIELEKPIITLEFAPEERQRTDEQLNRVLAGVIEGMSWVASNGDAQPNLKVAEALPVQSIDGYSATTIGRSAGGLPLRAEAIGQGDRSVVILAGLDATGDRRGPYLAEHLRRRLIERVPQGDLPRVHILTAPNPDGVLRQRTLNGRGVDVGEALIQRGDAPEAQAVRAWLDTIRPALVIVLDSDPEEAAADRFQLGGGSITTITRFGGDIGYAPGLDGRIGPALVDEGYTVLRLRVATEFARGDTRNNTDPFVRPARFSDVVLKMLADLSWLP